MSIDSRFVVLFHETPAGASRPSHWDLMLEQGGALRTWALEQEPRSEVSIVAAALPDHRLAYLDYEGPISGDRGCVTRWDQGAYRIVAESAHELKVELAGARFQGVLKIVIMPDANA